jgi:microcystin-dependent protein
MPIESASYVNQLNSAYPAATDGVKEGDDHIRLVKKVLKDTFPNLDAAVTKTAADLNAVPREIPIGGIIMWSGTLVTIPTNFKLCDGSTHARSDGAGNITTPNLLNRFIVGAGDGANTGANPSKYAIGATGGADTVTLTSAQIPAHNHAITASGSTSSAGSHSHSISDPGHSHALSNYGDYRAAVGTGLNGASTRYDGTTGYTTASGTGISIAAAGDHTHSLTITATAANTGGGEGHENRPPYFALAYIMRI